MWPKDPVELYNVACDLALCEPVVKQSAEQQEAAAEAVRTLSQAVTAGWSDPLHTSRDPDLDSLRDRDDFRALLGELFDRPFPSDVFKQ